MSMSEADRKELMDAAKEALGASMDAYRNAPAAQAERARHAETQILLDAAPEARRAEQAIDKAVTTYEAERKKLYRADGEPKFGEKELAERQEGLLAGVREAVDAAIQVADELQKAARVEAIAASATDPTAGLSADELQTASLKTQFVREDVARLRAGVDANRPGPLEERLQVVLASDDRVLHWLYHRYCEQEAGALREIARRPRGQISNDQSRRLSVLAQAAQQLGEKLVDPALKKKADLAEARRQRGMDLSMKARRQLGEVDGSQERARAAYRAHIRRLI